MPKLINTVFASAILLSGSSAAFAQSHEISGTVDAPRGVSVSGTQVVACSVPYQECKTKVETVVEADGSYTLKLPNAGPYQIMAWKDSDRNEQTNGGDYVVAAREGKGISAPLRGLNMTLWQVEGGQTASASDNSAIPGLAGRWTQASNTTELVIGSTIKQQAAWATSGGTNLGGTFGPGSATNSVIVTESKPMPVKRNMDLAIRPDGSFMWQITKVQPEGKTCTRTIRQEKEGRVSTEGSKITFTTTGGTESWSSSCGKSGSGEARKIKETYDFVKSGSTLTVKGSGGVNWTFRKS